MIKEVFLHEISQEFENILNFWQHQTVDLENGGFYGQITNDYQVNKMASKSAVLNTRILWTFSEAYKFWKKPVYRKLADRAYQYLSTYFYDPDFGGIYWEVDAHGQVINSKKQIYAQAFGIYALSAYYEISKKENAKEKAIELYHLIEKYSLDQDLEGYLEAFDKGWQLLEDLRLSEQDANEKKTMNTHLHILEAYTALYRIWPNAQLSKSLKGLIQIFLDKIVDHQTGHLNLFFDEHWQVKSHAFSYGHDIEGSWLLYEAAEILNDPEITPQVERAALILVNKTLEEGMDSDGGILNEGNLEGLIDGDKHWWPQAEALVGFINAYQLTKQSNYLEQAYHTWDFIKNKIIDPQSGEWFFKVSREGKVYLEEDLVGFWKCPYHNSRACLEVLNRARQN